MTISVSQNIPRSSTPLSGANYDQQYRSLYPDGMNLKPGSELHDKLRNFILERAEASQNRISARYDSWRSQDKLLTGCIYADEEERNLKQDDPRKPIAMVVPMSKAILDARLTYFSNIFLVNPYFRLGPMDPTDEIGVLLLERCVEAQMMRCKAGLNLNTWFRDDAVYGFGAMFCNWEAKWGKKLERIQTGIEASTGFQQTGTQKKLVDGLIWEGNTLQNIDPYRLLPDANVPIHEIQKGEFIAWKSVSNYYNLLGMERYNSKVFNVRYLQHISGRSSIIPTKPDERDCFGVRSLEDTNDSYSQTMQAINFCATIIPKDFGMGSGEYPEKWFFQLIGDEVIIQAEPLEVSHNMYPLATISTSYDGYELCPPSELELMHDLQVLGNYQLNSYVANMRKAVNDVVVYDPSVLNPYDMENQKAGKLVRARRTAFGKSIKDAVFQLQISDITRNNITDLQAIWGMAERSSAITDSLLGMRRQTSERVTAQEDLGNREAALARIEKSAKLASIQGMQDMAYMLAHNTQLFMSDSTFIRITGRGEELLRRNFPTEMIEVTPDMISVDFDIVPHDIRSLHKKDPNFMLQMFQIAAGNPNFAAQYDLGRMYQSLASEGGWEEIGTYRLPQLQVMPDQQFAEQQQKGNIVPIQQGQP